MAINGQISTPTRPRSRSEFRRQLLPSFMSYGRTHTDGAHSSYIVCVHFVPSECDYTQIVLTVTGPGGGRHVGDSASAQPKCYTDECVNSLRRLPRSASVSPLP